MKTPEEMAIEYIKDVETARNPSVTATAFPQMQRCFLAGYKAAQEWISVKDRLPEEGKEILWYHQPGGEFAVGYLLDEATQPFFTHWMPLPEPPKEEK